jgi:hypothetical protein
LTRLQFIIVTGLSILVALCTLLQLYLVHASAQDENRLRVAGAALQEGQLDYNRLQQVANWTATLSEQKNDPELRDILARNNIQVKSSPAPAPSAPAAPSAVPSTH